MILVMSPHSTTVYTWLCFHRERGYSVSEGFVWFVNLNGQLQISGQSEVQWISGQSNNRHDQPRTDPVLNTETSMDIYTHTGLRIHKHAVLLEMVWASNWGEEMKTYPSVPSSELLRDIRQDDTPVLSWLVLV